MNYVKELVDQYPFLMELLVLFATFLGAIATVWAARQEAAGTTVKERYENLIFPLFNALEPVLFQDEPTTDISIEMIRIFTDNRQWADGELLERFHYYRSNPCPSTFRKLCALVNSRYDSCCRRLGLSVRTYAYRRDKGQFEGTLAKIVFRLNQWLRFLLIIFVMILAYFLATLAYEPLFYKGLSPVFYLGLILFIYFLMYKLVFHSF